MDNDSTSYRKSCDYIYQEVSNKLGDMCRKNLCLYVRPLSIYFPDVIKKIEEEWTLKYYYDKHNKHINFICPIQKK